MKIFIQSDGKALGPCTIEQIQSLLAGGWISPHDLAKYEHEADWRELSSFPEFLVKDPIASARIESTPAVSPAATSPAPIRERVVIAKSEKAKTPAKPPPKPSLGEKLRMAIKLPAYTIAKIPWRKIPVRGILVILGLVAAVAVVFYLGRLTYSSLSRRYQAYQEKRAAAVKQGTTGVAASTNQVASTLEVAVAEEHTSNEVAAVPAVSVLPAIMLESNSVESTTMPDDNPQVPAKRRYIAHSVDPKATPFGGYDVGLIQAIQKHWLEILEQQDIVKGRSGKVIVEFRLSADGKVTHLRVVESTADEMLSYLCQKAIMEQSPWSPWPEELRPLIKDNYRAMRFTFYY